MPTLPRRRFTVRDAMVLIAVTAVGICYSRELPSSLYEELLRGRTFFVVLDVLYVGGYIALATTPMAVLWTLSVTVLGLLAPLASARRTVQPGWIACAAVSLELLLSVIRLVLSLPTISWALDKRWLMSGTEFPARFDSLLVIQSTLQTTVYGFGVVVAWFSVLMCRPSRAQPDWIEWTGRVLGIYWIVLIPLAAAVRFFPS